MDRFEAMGMLLRTAERGSFSQAARDMRIPVATLSRKVADLETLLGTQLLMRTTRRLSLTDAGVAYVNAARRILEQVEDAEREAAGEFTAPKGELVITAPLFFGRLHVLPVVSDFLALFPQINIRLVLGDRNVNLLDNQIDMAVRIGALPDSGMIATRVGLMRMVIAASPTLLAGHGIPQTPDDLKRIPCITADGPTLTSGWRFRHPETGNLFEVPIVPRLVTTAEGAADAAARSIGVSRLLYYQVHDGIQDGQLKIVLEPYELAPLPIHLLHVARSQMPLKMRRFLDFAAPRLREAVSRLDSDPKPDP